MPGEGRIGRDDYLEQIDGMIYGEDPSQGFVRGRTFVHPDLRFAFDVPAGYRIVNTPAAVIGQAQNSLMKFDAVGVPAGRDVGAYLARDWAQELGAGRLGNVAQAQVNGMPAASAVAAGTARRRAAGHRGSGGASRRRRTGLPLHVREPGAHEPGSGERLPGDGQQLSPAERGRGRGDPGPAAAGGHGRAGAGRRRSGAPHGRGHPAAGAVRAAERARCPARRSLPVRRSSSWWGDQAGAGRCHQPRRDFCAPRCCASVLRLVDPSRQKNAGESRATISSNGRISLESSSSRCADRVTRCFSFFFFFFVLIEGHRSCRSG